MDPDIHTKVILPSNKCLKVLIGQYHQKLWICGDVYPLHYWRALTQYPKGCNVIEEMASKTDAWTEADRVDSLNLLSSPRHTTVPLSQTG